MVNAQLKDWQKQHPGGREASGSTTHSTAIGAFKDPRRDWLLCVKRTTLSTALWRRCRRVLTARSATTAVPAKEVHSANTTECEGIAKNAVVQTFVHTAVSERIARTAAVQTFASTTVSDTYARTAVVPAFASTTVSDTCARTAAVLVSVSMGG